MIISWPRCLHGSGAELAQLVIAALLDFRGVAGASCGRKAVQVGEHVLNPPTATVAAMGRFGWSGRARDHR